MASTLGDISAFWEGKGRKKLINGRVFIQRMEERGEKGLFLKSISGVLVSRPATC